MFCTAKSGVTGRVSATGVVGAGVGSSTTGVGDSTTVGAGVSLEAFLNVSAYLEASSSGVADCASTTDAGAGSTTGVDCCCCVPPFGLRTGLVPLCTITPCALSCATITSACSGVKAGLASISVCLFTGLPLSKIVLATATLSTGCCAGVSTPPTVGCGLDSVNLASFCSNA